MRVTLFLLLQTIVLSQTNAQYNTTDFQKFWVCKSDELQKTEEDGIIGGYLEICPKLATWEVFSNQLYLMFKPKMKGDTLLLIYKQNDVGRGFWDFRPWPIVGKPFAKLYKMDDRRLAITYLNKGFVKAVKQRVSAPIEEKKLIFPAVIFLNEKRKSACED